MTIRPAEALADQARTPAFDRRDWRPSTSRLAAAGCVLAFACAVSQTALVSGSDGWWLSLFIAVEVGVMLLPWGLPRNSRSGRSFWAEALLGLTAPTAALAIVLISGPPWLSSTGDPAWFAVAIGFGFALIWMSGMDLGALLRGHLAFLLGPTPASHTLARAFTTAASPFGEETIFRGIVLAASPPVAMPIGLLAAVAFVARHHVSRGGNWRGSARAMGVEITAAAGLMALTMASHSIYPALVAHLINNAPMVLLHLQRAGLDDETTT